MTTLDDEQGLEAGASPCEAETRANSRHERSAVRAAAISVGGLLTMILALCGLLVGFVAVSCQALQAEPRDHAASPPRVP